jgi:hypothetical protein
MPSAEYQRAWRKTNPGKYATYCEKWRTRHPGAAQAASKRHYDKHRETILRRSSEYRERNKEKIAKRWAEYWQKHKDRLRPINAVKATAWYRSLTLEQRLINNSRARELRKKNHHKVRARMKAYVAKRSGKLRPPRACSMCARVAHLEMHHPDYSRPLFVQWLCRPCHGITRRLS